MKKLNLFFIILLALTAVFSCNEKKPVATEQNEAKPAEKDTSVYGTCGEATSRAVLSLLTDGGDSLTYLLEYDTLQAEVLGGLFNDNHLAVIGFLGSEGLCARKVINLSSLLGTWSDMARNFEIKEGGVVQSNVKNEKSPYKSWKVFNGKLILSADTFEILSLGADSLIIEDNEGIYGYKRDTNVKIEKPAPTEGEKK